MSHLTDSNRRPSDYKSKALPTELRGHFNYLIESVQTESLQVVESTAVESEVEVDVLALFEQAEIVATATIAIAKINFFIFFCFVFIIKFIMNINIALFC